MPDPNWRTRLKTGPPADRLRARLDKSATCWIWTGYTNHRGYGVMRVGSRADGTRRTVLTHRLAWESINGPVAAGLRVCHRCDTPACCRPDHLFLGSDVDNAADRDGKGRWRGVAGERVHTAKLTEDDVRRIRALHAAGDGSYTTLGRRFGVTKEMIGQIVQRRAWKHVQ